MTNFDAKIGEIADNETHPRTFICGAYVAKELIEPKLMLAVDCLKKLSEMEEPAWIRLDENIKMSVAFYAREAMEKINTPY